MNNKTDTPVTVIGLGRMGQALAGAFLKAGHPTTVWNRTTSKADQLVAEGARLAPTVGDALKAGSLTIICVTDYQAMHELLGASDVELGGTMLINLTSGDSAQAREAAQWAEQRGAHCSQDAGELRAVGAGALDADGDDLAVRAQPVEQPAVAVRGSGESLGGQVSADGVDHGGLVEIGVGVDAADHRYLVCHPGCCCPSVRRVRDGARRSGGRTRL